MKKIWLTSAALAFAIIQTGASPAFAKKAKAPAGPIAISAKDKQTGAKAHPQILAEFGGAYTAAQTPYVVNVGQKIAVQSGLSNAKSDFTVTLLNSSVNNAFAIPGGYVYVTRQLMGLMNSEAELASVLGHEVGHVAARHSQKRNSRATIGGLGTLAATVLGGVLLGGDGAKLGQQLGGTIAQTWVLGYSRAQEYEADDLGVSYLSKSGYDPAAASAMLASLAAQTALDTRRSGKSGNALPEWASTHPDPASRVTRARQKAATTGSTSKTVNRDAFLAALDGMLYDDDPKQGVVDGQSFKHPDLKLYFTAPAGYVMNNGADAVSISGSGGQAKMSGGAYTGDIDAYVAAVFKSVAGANATLNFGQISKSTINGLKSATAAAPANTQSGQMLVTVYAYEFDATTAYYIVSITPAAQSANPFASLFQSMRKLTAQEAAAVKPRVIDVITVKSGDTMKSLSDRMAYGDYKLERFQVLNGLAGDTILKPGQKVKIVITGL